MELVFATGNRDKVQEVREILQSLLTEQKIEISIVTPAELGLFDDIPENGSTLEENAEEKCLYLWEKLGRNCFADDTGLEVDMLGGAPGVFTARYAGPSKDHNANMDKVLAEMQAVEERNRENPPARTARFRACIALKFNGTLYRFEGVMEGTIARERAGVQGFGYDPIFIPEGNTRTLAEMTLHQKNAISHRGKAVRALAEFLKGASR